MHKYRSIFLIGILCLLLLPVTTGALTIEKLHHHMLYPVVRVNESGSGTIIYSKPNDEGTYSTYVLTNHHVVGNKINITEEWSSKAKKEVKMEKRSKVPVEIFQYKQLSTPIGTLKIDSRIIAYSSSSFGMDLALLKLELETEVPYVAIILPRGEDIKVFSKLVAVGCSLKWPPVPSTGILTRKNQDIGAYPYHMSEAQIIYGNSGGAMFLAETGEMIGVPAKIPALDPWGTEPVTHMGCFIPIDTVYDWLEELEFQFLYDPAYPEKEALDNHEKRPEDVEIDETDTP